MSTPWPDLADGQLTGAIGLLAMGLSGSAHCFAMCGPLAGATPSGVGGGRLSGQVAYHAARLLAYAAVGGALGALGAPVVQAFAGSAGRVLPWLVAAALAGAALGLGRFLERLPGLGRLAGRLLARVRTPRPVVRGAALGAVTPLLPCGWLYGALPLGAASGSVGSGALLLLAFGLGALPALALAQSGWRLPLPPKALRAMRVAVPLVAAAVIVYREVLVLLAPAAPPACH